MRTSPFVKLVHLILIFCLSETFFADSLSLKDCQAGITSEDQNLENIISFSLNESKDSTYVQIQMKNGFLKDSTISLKNNTLCFDLSHFIGIEMKNETCSFNVIFYGLKNIYCCIDSVPLKINEDSFAGNLHQMLSSAGIILSNEKIMIYKDDYHEYRSYNSNFESSFVNNIFCYGLGIYDDQICYSDMIYEENINDAEYIQMIDSLTKRKDSKFMLDVFKGHFLRKSDLKSFYEETGEFYYLMQDYEKYTNKQNFSIPYTFCLMIPLGIFFMGVDCAIIYQSYKIDDMATGMFLLPFSVIIEGVLMFAAYGIQYFFNKGVGFIFRNKKRNSEERLTYIKETILNTTKSIEKESERNPTYRMLRHLMLDKPTPEYK
jgi:hypothetical protein